MPPRININDLRININDLSQMARHLLAFNIKSLSDEALAWYVWAEDELTYGPPSPEDVYRMIERERAARNSQP